MNINRLAKFQYYIVKVGTKVAINHSRL